MACTQCGAHVFASGGFIVAGQCENCGSYDLDQITPAAADLSDDIDRERRRCAAGVLDAAVEPSASIDEHGTIIGWSRGAENLLGWQRAEVLGSALADTITPPRLRSKLLGGLTRLQAEADRSEVDRLLEVCALHRDGREVSVEISVSSFKDQGRTHLSAFLRGAGGRRCSAEAERDLRTSARSSAAVIWATNELGEVVHWNAAAEQLYGYTAQEILESPIGLVIPAERKREEREVLRRVMVGEPLGLAATEGLRRDGTRVRISLGLSPLRDHTGAFTGAIGMVEDLDGLATTNRGARI